MSKKDYQAIAKIISGSTSVNGRTLYRGDVIEQLALHFKADNP
jgi:hypothetical protein